MDSTLFYAPHFETDVILTSERRRHIMERHSDLGSAPRLDSIIQETLLAPVIIQKSKRDRNGLVFVRWHPELHNGKFLLVVVIDDPDRKWIITAYCSHEIPAGEILWAEA